MPTPERILIIRPSALGDVCRSVPVLVSLRQAFPNAHIDWLVREAFAGAIADHPSLDSALPFRRKALGKRRIGSRSGREALGQLLTMLRGGPNGPPYDLVLDVQGLGRSGLFARLTGAPRRAGFADARELGWLGLNERVRVDRAMHTVDRMLALVQGIGVEPARDLRLYTSEPDREWAASALPSSRIAVVAPTSVWPGKRWPQERFARVVDAMLTSKLIDGVAIVAAAHEAEQCAQLRAMAQQDARVIDLVGTTTVGGLMGVIERSGFVLANDSAALHMAVGFDKPLLALFGPTRIDRVGPYGRENDVLQPIAPEPGMSHKDEARGRAMMEAITVESVIEAVCTRLEGDAGRRETPLRTEVEA